MSHDLLGLLADAITDHLRGQILAGAQLVQLFDSWAGLLGPEGYRRHALPHLLRIGSALKQEFPDVPLAVFPRGAHYVLEDLVETPYDVISLDWTIDPSEARTRTGGKVTLQGNLDPTILFASKETVRNSVKQMVEGFGVQRYIANLGHGMMPQHDPERVADFVNAVQEFAGELSPLAEELPEGSVK